MHEPLPVVLLPGFDGTIEPRQEVVARLARLRPVRAVTYPTDRPRDYDELLAIALREAPSGRFVIVGESFSGPLAIEIAATVPRVAALVLVSSFACCPVPRLLAPLARFADPGLIPRWLIRQMLLGAFATPRLESMLWQSLEHLPRDVVRARATEAARADKRHLLSAVRCPMLILHGRRDRLIGPWHVRRITACKPDCRVVWLDAPHMLLETHAEAAVDAIEQFCRSVELAQE